MVYDKLKENEFNIVRNYNDFVNYIIENGLPDFISFDNDLGLDENGEVVPDGYAATKWLVFDSGLDLRNLKFYVHSVNLVAAQQIKGYWAIILNCIFNILNCSTMRRIRVVAGESFQL